MTLAQYHELKVWHLRHWRRQPVEKHCWDAVLTLWMMGWVGTPAAFLVDATWVELLGVTALFLPSTYVALRAALHRRRWLRCDWLIALK